METNTSPAPVRGNFAAIPSSSSEWPTIEQANNMAVQALPAKPVAPSKAEKASDDVKSSPELSDGSQEVFEENFASVVNKSEDVAAANSTEVAKTFTSSTPVTSGSTQTALSAWKPYRQSPQSMGACTSAVTTSASSSVTVISSKNTESRLTSMRHSSSEEPASYKPHRAQGNHGAQVQSQSRSRASENTGATPVASQEDWEPKVPQAFQELF